MDNNTVIGRFAPSPTGRMHAGNVFTALASWLSVRRRGGRWILRIEDLDPQRSRRQWAQLIEDDLQWLGLDFDEGGLEDRGEHGPYSQSCRHDIYLSALERLHDTGLVYPCYCTRADIMATQAPHRSDGRVVYAGTCRPVHLPQPWQAPARPAAERIYVPDADIQFIDGLYGPQRVNLAHECGDFILRRADGAWAYQLAVVVDDDAMGVNEVMRGNDLMLSVGQQNYLRNLLNMRPVKYTHLPLLCNAAGQRLSKRDSAMSMETLRQRYTACEVLGHLSRLMGINPEGTPCHAHELIGLFDIKRIPAVEKITASFAE